MKPMVTFGNVSYRDLVYFLVQPLKQYTYASVAGTPHSQKDDRHTYNTLKANRKKWMESRSSVYIIPKI